MPGAPEAHYGTVVKGLSAGRVVPLLGAGANLCGRPEAVKWDRRQTEHLPSGGELARYLAKNFGYPDAENTDLARVSQYVRVMAGSGPLYEELRGLFNADFPPTQLHALLAGAPAKLREKGYAPGGLLVVTTNYDDCMERAFQVAEEPYDVVSYVAEGQARGKFYHTPPGEAPRLIEKPNEYGSLALDGQRNLVRSVVLKLHGAVDRSSSERDSYVITEDDYIDYLSRTDISNLVPVTLQEKLKRSHFLFLGYSLRDWNLRVILHRIWGQQKLKYKSWAIQLHPDELEQEFWRTRDVDILDVPLETYVSDLARQVSALKRPSKG